MTTKTAQFRPGPWVVNTFLVNGQHKLEVLDATGANACVQANATLIAAAPAMYEALQNLLEWAKGNRGAREGNPYCKPEVRQALKVLASIQDKKDYIDADTAPQAEGQHHE